MAKVNRSRLGYVVVAGRAVPANRLLGDSEGRVVGQLWRMEGQCSLLAAERSGCLITAQCEDRLD